MIEFEDDILTNFLFSSLHAKKFFFEWVNVPIFFKKIRQITECKSGSWRSSSFLFITALSQIKRSFSFFFFDRELQLMLAVLGIIFFIQIKNSLTHKKYMLDCWFSVDL